MNHQSYKFEIYLLFVDHEHTITVQIQYLGI
jgi:hypothetical protein